MTNWGGIVASLVFVGCGEQPLPNGEVSAVFNFDREKIIKSVKQNFESKIPELSLVETLYDSKL